ncbi:NUAK family SNF1-like kinase 1 [Gadus macrocephalus]|uniref:NUAK family SNF1-like kinase 1 n=1 Tax=Gadus macrocephalus TaxID=80720 RepID=UPI0028CB8C7B|nr:NUAK family SNF1-like kinase 1 [Gadus macrocephalus]
MITMETLANHHQSRRRSSAASTVSEAGSTGPELTQTWTDLDHPLPVDYPGLDDCSSATLEEGGRWSSVGGSGVKKHNHKHNLKHRYELLETLGRGTYGKVKKAIERHTGRVVSVLCMLRFRTVDVESSMMCEVKLRYNRCYIVQLCSALDAAFPLTYLSNLPQNGVVHRDLKLENVLLDDNCNIKIADFGLSNLYHKDKFLQTFCGSPLYASPEIVNGRPYHGPEVDSWALGVLLYTLVYGTMPFDGGDHIKLIKQISNGDYKEPAQSSDARGLIRWMLMVNPERRATVEDIANHWWVNWGWKSSVCDCQGPPSQGSPMLARFIDWQSRASGGATAAAAGPDPAPSPGSSYVGRRLKKPTRPEAECGPRHPTPAGEDKQALKRPKSILKTRASDHRSQSLGELELRRTLHFTDGDARLRGGEVGMEDEDDEDDEDEDDEEEDEDHGCLGGSPAKMVPTLPKKGILKNSRPNHLLLQQQQQQQRESGYYSSSERSDSSEPQGGAAPTVAMTPAASSPSKRGAGRKGILKRNGKFSANTHHRDGKTCSTAFRSDAAGSRAAGEAGLSRSQSRPSGFISEDTPPSLPGGASSFGGLDWPPGSPRPGSIRGCLSAEDLLQPDGFRGLHQGPAHGAGKVSQGTQSPGSPGENGSFSLLGDMDDVTQVYQRALDISCAMRET